MDAGDDADGDGGERDAGADAGKEHDAGHDAGPCGPVTSSSGTYLGNTCPGVVTCQDPSNAQSGKYVLSCDLGDDIDQPDHHCCIGDPAPSNTCSSTDCGANQVEATCDGPEDCNPGSGKQAYCCIANFTKKSNSTFCATNPCADAEQTVCHGDADCPSGYTCKAGHDFDLGYLVPVTAAKWMGFCYKN